MAAARPRLRGRTTNYSPRKTMKPWMRTSVIFVPGKYEPADCSITTVPRPKNNALLGFDGLGVRRAFCARALDRWW